jgi:HEAT repeat protein/regulator of RNase E activity RraB
MKVIRQRIPEILLVILIFIIYYGCSQIDTDKFESSLAALKTYQFGDSRVVLSEIELLVAQTREQADIKMIASRLAEILDSDVSFATRQFICQQLRVIGNEEQIPVLTKLLLEEENTNIAVFALETMPSLKVDETFRNSLTILKDKDKIAVINALGERKNNNSISVLTPLLSDADMEIAEAAALALGKIGTFDSGMEIKKAMDKADGEWRSNIAKYYLMCANNMAARGEAESAVKIYKELSEEEKNRQIQMRATYGLVTTGHMNALEFVSQAIKDEDTIIRRLAMKTVIKTQEKDATGKFCELLSDLPPNSQSLLIMALSDRGDRGALTTIVNLLDHNDKQVRLAALGATAKLGNETVVPKVLGITVEADEDESEAARMCLNRLRGSEVDDKVIEMANNENVEIRLEAIKALAARNAVIATPTLIKMTGDAIDKIRIEAWKSLAELGSDNDLSQMISSWIQAKKSTEIQVAEDAVVKVCQNATTKHKYTTDIAAAVGKEENKEIKISLINALGRIGANESLPLLQDLLTDKDSDIQAAAIRGLSLWPTDGPLEDLRHIVTITSDETQKIIALRGYIYLIGLATNRESAKTLAFYQDAMNLSWRSEEKRLVLTGYSHVKNFDALKAVEKYLLDKELENEAAAAALTICHELTEETTNRAEKGRIALILDMIIQNNKIESIRAEAQNIATKMEE